MQKHRQRPRMLVAYRNPGIRHLLRGSLGKPDTVSSPFELARAVFDLLRRGAPDVISMSAEMCDLQGVELVSRVHAVSRTPPLVLIPNRGPVAPGKVLDAGADDCLGKAFLLGGLAAQTRRGLHRAGVRLGLQVPTGNLGALEINCFSTASGWAVRHFIPLRSEPEKSLREMIRKLSVT